MARCSLELVSESHVTSNVSKSIVDLGTPYSGKTLHWKWYNKWGKVKGNLHLSQPEIKRMYHRLEKDDKNMETLL